MPEPDDLRALFGRYPTGVSVLRWTRMASGSG